ncbi:O-antigen ligase family protein [Bradyrhizobium sp. AUGA SZCCT0431]|nr:O-antigen ligase family protein [Bradyrhizobium sp. AUGA SZCCT0431]
MGGASNLVAIAVFVLAPFPLGSADFVWIWIWIVLLALSLLTADLEAIGREDFRLLLPLFMTMALISTIVMLQTWSGPLVGRTNPVWKLPSDLLGADVPARISMTAAGPWLAFGSPLLMSLAFVRAFLLAADAPAAQRLLRILAWAGFLYACYGILAQLADPNTLLFRQKEAYLGFATGTFVNRNTAATFWGSGALLFLVPLLRSLHRGDRRVAAPSDRPLALLGHYLATPAALAVGFTVCTLATAMTGSRAGLLLSICAFLLAGTLYLWPLELGTFRRWALLAGAAVVSVLVLQLIGGAVAGRILTYGLIDDQRLAAYRAAIAIVSDHPLFGIGLGNFEAAFAAYRPAELGSLGIWDRAHSTPLQLAVEIGLPATIPIIATVLWYVYQLFRGSLLRRRDRYIPVTGASVAVLGLLHSSIDFSLQIAGYGVFFAAISGAGLAQCLPSSLRKNGGGAVASEL